MRLVVDSNIFVSGLDPKDVFHSECKPIIDRIVKMELEAVCPTLVLVEVVCVIKRRTSNELTARRTLKNLSRLPSIIWLELSFPVALKASILGSQTGVKGGDAVVIQVSEQLGIPLLTNDREIGSKAPKGVIVWDPSHLDLTEPVEQP